MNANYIYDIFATCEELDLPDLTVALAHRKAAHPIPEGMTEQGINEFVGNHYEALGGRPSRATTVMPSRPPWPPASRRTRSARPPWRPVRRAESMLICIDAGHYIGTPGKRCLKSIDPGRPGSGP